jgi:hypothetical protein
LGLRPGKRWTPARGGWTEEELKLLGADRGSAVAERLGRSPSSVTSQRTRLGMPAFSGRPGGGGRGWAAEESPLLGTDTDEAVAEKIGRAPSAVAWERARLKAPTFLDRRCG